MFQVTYKTAVRPTDLPAGAVVEQIPREFPVTITTPFSREFTVDKYAYGASIKVRADYSGGESIMAAVESSIARELAHAILEAIGDGVPVDDSEVTVVQDGDDDYWVRASNGKFRCTYSSQTLSPDRIGTTLLEDLRRDYPTLKVIR